MKTRGDLELLTSRTHTHTVQWATGDGTTKVFHLAKTPANPSQLKVFVAGLLKRPNDRGTAYDYALSGSTVTFTAAPANLAAIAFDQVAA